MEWASDHQLLEALFRMWVADASQPLALGLSVQFQGNQKSIPQHFIILV